MRRRYGCPLLIGLLFLACGWAADPLPPKPARYVNDAAGVLNPQTAAQLNQRLEEFERKTSNQVLVATFPRVPEGYAMEDFTQRTAESWGVGQKQTDNGAVLFVFPQDRKMRIEVGYGLEGVLPDALAKRIIENEIVPAFRAGDFNAGIARGADAIMRAATGEYKGTGRTVAEREAEGSPLGGILGGLFVLLIIFIVLQSLGQMGRGTSYGRRGRNDVFPLPFGGGSWGGGGGSRRSGGGFGGGGGFSGGGGSFGGGGASGSW